ncbi:UNVERIFIED_CONTAM: hypothetical protein K2H54_010298 [Gekko kuhli]
MCRRWENTALRSRPRIPRSSKAFVPTVAQLCPIQCHFLPLIFPDWRSNSGARPALEGDTRSLLWHRRLPRSADTPPNWQRRDPVRVTPGQGLGHSWATLPALSPGHSAPCSHGASSPPPPT